MNKRFLHYSIITIIILLEFLFLNSTNVSAADYYVNDNNMDGMECWTTATGTAGASGAMNDPYDSIQRVIDSRILQQGDRVFVDVGTYNEGITITQNDSGDATDYVYFIACTNGDVTVNAAGSN